MPSIRCRTTRTTRRGRRRLVRIQTYHSQAFAKFLAKLAAMPDGDGSMLDHSILLYGSNMSNSNAHDEFPLPTMRVGRRLRKDQGRPAPEVPGPDAAGEPAPDTARARRSPGGQVGNSTGVFSEL